MDFTILNNRYGHTNRLIKVGRNTYKLQTSIGYLRCGYERPCIAMDLDVNLKFIDPDGGPMITKGNIICIAPRVNSKVKYSAYVRNIKQVIGKGIYLTLYHIKAYNM